MIPGTMQISIPKVGERYIRKPANDFTNDLFYIKVVEVDKRGVIAEYMDEPSGFNFDELKFWYLEKYYRLASEEENEALKIKEMIG